nr:MAG TPA: hypothetical protein [Caudoviricetes sp.]DAW49827.1 MAG TPA: hypothetical protein [Caudoviricetes sp.]
MARRTKLCVFAPEHIGNILSCPRIFYVVMNYI